MATLSNCMDPTAASVCLTMSFSPSLTPPLVTTRSARTNCSDSASRNARGSSGIAPALYASAPEARMAAASMKLLPS